MSERTRAARQNGSDAAETLWNHLRNRQIEGCEFRRDHPIGCHFADFACPGCRLVVEVDGEPINGECDAIATRTQDVEAMGYRVIRFWSHEVLQNPDAVLAAIRLSLRQGTMCDGAAAPARPAPDVHAAGGPGLARRD